MPSQDIEDGRISVIVTSPNMCLEHEKFRGLLNSASFAMRIGAFVLDEAHCITQWGDKFREVYSKLGTLRAFASHTPFLATSATLTPDDLTTIRKSVHFSKPDTFHLNLGNDRPNITWHVVHMNAGKSDLESLEFLLPKDCNATRLGKVIVFFDEILLSMKAWRWFRERLPEHLRGRIAYYNSRRGESSKLDAATQFCNDKIDIMFSSEALGMVSDMHLSLSAPVLTSIWKGCDLPNIESVVQFMVPASLSIWLQRAGRAGRTRGSQAHAYLLVQPTVFQEKNKTKRAEGDEIEYMKVVEKDLRRWIQTCECRRDVADEHFNNPVNREGQFCFMRAKERATHIDGCKQSLPVNAVIHVVRRNHDS